MKDLVVVGSLNADLVLTTPAMPEAGETLLVHGHRKGFGGKGGNQAVAAARLGAKTAMVGRVGDDQDGRRYRALLAVEKVDVEAVVVDPDLGTGLAVVLVEDHGENRILVSSGGNAALTARDIEADKDLVEDASVILAQLETSQEVAIAAFRRARGLRILNAAPPPATLNPELIELTDILIVNEIELAAIAGSAPPRDPSEASDVAGRIKSGVTVVVTLGANGSIARLPDGTWWHEPAIPVAAVDTTAAGDAFCGALAVELGRGTALESALRQATEVSALTVTRHGAIDSLPTSTDLISFREGLTP